MEYWGVGGKSRFSLSWATPCNEDVTAVKWRVEYYANTTLNGSPLIVRDQGNNNSLDFNWGVGSLDSAF
jgi:hypothetical protein